MTLHFYGEFKLKTSLSWIYNFLLKGMHFYKHAHPSYALNPNTLNVTYTSSQIQANCFAQIFTSVHF